MSSITSSPSTKKSRVLSLRDEVSIGNPASKSKSKSRIDSLKLDSSLYNENPSLGMNAIEQAKKMKELQKQYLQNQKAKKPATGGRKRNSRNRRKSRKHSRRRRKLEKSRRSRSRRRSHGRKH